VMGDAARLQQVVWNLLSNAIKFSTKGSDVTVRLAGDDEHVRITVVDRGVGIAPEFLPYVFDRFRQADGSTTRRFGGLGLGLSIVRHLADLHGGSVAARSEGEGRGSNFVLELPLHTMAGLRPIGQGPVAARGDVDLDGLAVLIVDDEPDVLELLSRVLSEANAQVRAAGDAAEALDALAQLPPALLIADIGMPGMDGYELIRRVRHLQDAAQERVPAVALTAFARPEDRQRALEAGFDVYLSKPVDPHDLLLAARRLLQDKASA
jgi:CheY-like chemotaxis protein